MDSNIHPLMESCKGFYCTTLDKDLPLLWSYLPVTFIQAFCAINLWYMYNKKTTTVLEGSDQVQLGPDCAVKDSS